MSFPSTPSNPFAPVHVVITVGRLADMMHEIGGEITLTTTDCTDAYTAMPLETFFPIPLTAL